jgi:hypothetical protein
MKLPALGIEYVPFTATADFELDGTLEFHVSTDPGYPGASATWVAGTWTDVEVIEENGDHVRTFTALLAGSAVPSGDVPPSAQQLSAGTNYVYVRLTDSPEIVIRPAGRVTGL